VLRCRDETKELSGGSPGTTSNRMHLQAALEGLRALERASKVHLYTASDYLQKGITLWVRKWRENGWRTQSGSPVKHCDLWQALLEAAAPHAVEWHLVSTERPDLLVRANQLARTDWDGSHDSAL
jgi:ribonuclease HI